MKRQNADSLQFVENYIVGVEFRMNNSMKYYVFVSDSKIDMLYPQITKQLLKRIASELSINLNILGTGISATIKSTQSEETRFSKLKIVATYIEKHLDVGTIDSWFAHFTRQVPRLRLH